jgi:hypothetical protein
MLTSVPTGSRWIPYVASAVSMAIGKLSPARAKLMVNKDLHQETTIAVCIDNIRGTGATMLMTAMEQQYTKLCQETSITINNPAGTVSKVYVFLGVLYNHDTKQGALSEKSKSKLHNILDNRIPKSASTYLPIHEMLSIFGYLVYASRVCQPHIAPFFHFFKYVRRRVRHAETMNSASTWWACAILQATEWTKTLLKADPITPTVG